MGVETKRGTRVEMKRWMGIVTEWGMGTGEMNRSLGNGWTKFHQVSQEVECGTDEQHYANG